MVFLGGCKIIRTLHNCFTALHSFRKFFALVIFKVLRLKQKEILVKIFGKKSILPSQLQQKRQKVRDIKKLLKFKFNSLILIVE